MSLILDALNKADNERNQNNAPSITSNHDAAVIDSGNNGSKQLIVLVSAAAILLALAIILYLIFSSSGKEDSADPRRAQTEQQNPSRQVQRQAEPPMVDTAKKTQKPRKIDALKERMIAAQYQNAETETREETKSLSSKTPEQDLEQLEQNDKAVSAIYQQEQAPAPTPAVTAIPRQVTEIAPKPRIIPTAVPRVTPDPSTTLAKYPLLSFISDLPYSMQKSIPTIMYTRHKFRRGGDSFVKLNNAEFRAGQQVADKVFLEEILHDGIIVRYQSRKFKMVAMNSWVNM